MNQNSTNLRDVGGGGTVNSNILNRPTPTSSIYQKSLELLDKLAFVPGMEQFYEPLLNQKFDNSEQLYRDPMQFLWSIFQKGISLCILYNALEPLEKLEVEDIEQGGINTRKKAVYSFMKAVRNRQIGNEQDYFTITELFRDDTNSFLKVLRTVSSVLEVLEEENRLVRSLITPPPSSYFTETNLKDPTDNAERSVREFLDTERKYVQDLEILQEYMQELLSKNILSPTTVRQIFVNLNQMVDFQRRFLIGVEATAPQPTSERRFGALFESMEEGFSVYEPFIVNYERAAKIIVSNEHMLGQLSHLIEPHYELPSMLIKPVQRICKYPILVREMLKFCKESEDSATKRDLELCLEVSSRIATRVNSAQTREANLVIVKNLQERILDWKGYSISTFGELQLHDQFLMSTSDSARELQLYLFDQILICCKEVTDSNKRKSTRQSNGNILAAQSPSSTSNLGLTPLQLKGRIFLYSISRVINSSRNNNLSLTVFWRDVFMENFSLKCRSEEQLNIWKTTMERLIDRSKAAQTTEKQVPEADLPPLPDVDSSQVDRYTSDDDLIRSRDFPDTRKTYDGSSSGLISTHKETRSFSTVSKYSAAGSNVSGTDSMQFTMPYNTPPVPPMPSALSQRYTAPELATFKTSQGVRPFKVKIHYNEDMYILIVKTTISYSELLKKIEHKVRLCSDFQALEDHTKSSHQSNGTTPNSGPDSPTLSLKIRYMDEDGDLVLVASDDDVMMAFESASLGSVLQSTPDKLRSASLMTTNSVISTTSTNSTSTIPTLNLYVSL